MKSLVIAFLMPVLLVGSAQAHHAWPTSYTEEIITVEGTIERYIFRNPHVVFYINVEDEESGEMTRWMAEQSAATGLRLAGWDESTLSAGDYIRVTGLAGRNNRPMIHGREILRVDEPTGAVVQEVSITRRGIEPADPDSEDFNYPETFENGWVNLTGVWVQGGDARGPSFLLNEDPVFSEAGQAVQDSIRTEDDPQYHLCEPANLIRQVGFTPHPVRITQFDDRVEFDFEEYSRKRIVYLDDREYDNFDENERYLSGRYKARYEGDALIIQSDLIKGGWSGIFGELTSDEVTVVETYTRNFDEKWGPSVHLSMIIDDPIYLAEPREMFWDKYYTLTGFTGTERDNVQLDYEMIPVECQIPLTAE